MTDQAPSLAEMLRHFSFDVPWLIVLIAMAVGYAVAFRRSRRRAQHRQQASWRLAAFLGGVAILAIAVLSPLEYYGNQVLWVDFLGFLLVTMIAPPLLVLGAPLTLAFRVSGPSGRRRLRRFYRGWLMSRLAFPLTSWMLFAVVTYAWQFSNLTDSAATNDVVRDVQQFTLLLVAVLFWMPAICADPARWRMAWPLRGLYVFVEMTHKGLFGGMFLATNHTFHAGFASRLPVWTNLTAIADQRVAILVLWIGGNMVFVVAVVFILAGWLRYERRNTHRVDWRLSLQWEARRRRKAALEKVFTKGV